MLEGPDGKAAFQIVNGVSALSSSTAVRSDQTTVKNTLTGFVVVGSRV